MQNGQNKQINPPAFNEETPPQYRFQPAPVEPPANKPGHFKRNLLVGLIILAVAAGLTVELNKNNGNPEKPKDTSIALTYEVHPKHVNSNRVYRLNEASDTASTAKYSVLDKEGNVAFQGTGPKEIDMIAALGNGGFLFHYEGDLSNKSQYYLLDNKGFKKLDNLPASMDRGFIGSSDRATLYAYGQTDVLFYECDSDDTAGDKCKLHTVDIDSGKESTVVIPELRKAGDVLLLNISSDDQYAFFFDSSFETANSKMVYKFYKYDLASRKIVAEQQLELGALPKVWLSPNGKHLVYSPDNGPEKLSYVSLVDGTRKTIKLPAPKASGEPWGGETTTYDPQFSPDGNYMSFVSYLDDGQQQAGVPVLPEIMGLIDLNAGTSRKLITEVPDPKLDAGITYFSNFRWIDAKTVEFTGGQNNFRYIIGQKELLKIENEFGVFVGLLDGLN
jgi:hypothetical protein